MPALLVMACGLPVWSACNGGDATAPLAASVPAPAPVAELRVHRVVAPDTLRPGALMVLEGTGFATGPLDNEVTLVGGGISVHAHVVSATSTRLDLRLPDAAAFPCLPTGAHTLRITSAQRHVARPVIVAAARRIALGKGESLNLLAPSATWCTELDGGPSGARYAVAVLNTSHSESMTAGVQVRGSSAGTQAPATATTGPATAAPTWPIVAATTMKGGFPSAGADSHSDDDHASHLGRERARTRNVGPLTALWSAERARRVHAGRESGVRNSGAMSAVVGRPDTEGQLVQRTAMYQSCHSASTITARVVYAGARALVLEDVASPRARAMDAQLRAIGREFDEVTYPLLVSQVGDPLALDAAMQGNGRVTMLFSPYVNDSAPGTAGYVTACNLYPRSTFAHSNEAALFYARIPRVQETPAAWQRIMRSTVVHEAKHLASFAERLSRGVAFEEPWLEEATARIAEELYARTFSGGSWRDNTGWSGSLQCEVYQCDDRPLLMWKHFPVLHDYFAGVESLTPLGSAAHGDVTFYASGWSLVRWAVDHHAVHEGEFLRDLVRGTPGVDGSASTGIAALSARTGRPAEELLAEWSLANLLDDRPGFVPVRATLSFPGWHVPDLMAGLSAMNGARYSARPLPVRDVTGDRQVSVPPLRGFSASFLESAVAPNASQVLELRGANGGAVPAAIRLAIVRVE